MNQICIVCVDDEPEVLEAVERDLSEFDDHFPVESASSAKAARQLFEDLNVNGDHVGLVLCDHLMPEETGVELLVSLSDMPSACHARRVLLTGQASHADTIEALNQGGLDYYMAKPWAGKVLKDVVRDQLTSYVIEHSPTPASYMNILDGVKIAEFLHRSGGFSDH
jgi:response regulator RpfG family c-di-GMP phosphodiesterase